MSNIEDRVTELEIKLSHQDLLIEDFRQALDLHRQEIDVLQAKLKVLGERQGEKPANEKPPHY